MVRITPANGCRRSASLLAERLGAVVVNPRRQPNWNHPVINWGRSDIYPPVTPPRWTLNHPRLVYRALNKFETLVRIEEEFYDTELENLAIPFTMVREDAQLWLHSGQPVVARLKLRSRGGDGIVVVRPGEELPAAPLYTVYIERRTEYRVHVLNGNTFVTQRRFRNGQRDETNFEVRSHGNGWILSRRVENPPADLENAARNAISCLGLDFGAVDLLHNDQVGTRVLEINSAPGLAGQVLDFYVQNFQEILNGL